MTSLDQLKSENAVLRQENEALSTKVAHYMEAHKHDAHALIAMHGKRERLTQENQRLLADNDQLKAENAVLRQALEQLKQLRNTMANAFNQYASACNSAHDHLVVADTFWKADDDFDKVLQGVRAASTTAVPVVPRVFVNEDGQLAQLILEDVPCHAEWIPGEGGDISLIRALDDNRIVGADLPFPPVKPHGKKPAVIPIAEAEALAEALEFIQGLGGYLYVTGKALGAFRSKHPKPQPDLSESKA